MHTPTRSADVIVKVSVHKIIFFILAGRLVMQTVWVLSAEVSRYRSPPQHTMKVDGILFVQF